MATLRFFRARLRSGVGGALLFCLPCPVLAQGSAEHVSESRVSGVEGPGNEDLGEATTPAREAATTSPPGAQPQAVGNDVQVELESTFWRADDLFQQGAYPEAAAAFTRALELSRQTGVSDTWRQFSPHIAFNVAHSHRRAGNCEAAHMAFAHYRGLVAQLPTEHATWHDALLGECPQLRIDAATAQSTSSQSSGQELPQTDSNEPMPSGTWLLDVNTGQTAAPGAGSDVPSTDGGRVVGWSAAGAAAVSLGLAGAFWVSADNQQEIADGKRLWAEAEGYQDAANTRRVVAGVLAGVGVALGGTSVYLLTRPTTPESPSSKTVARTLALRSNGTNISVWGQF